LFTGYSDDALESPGRRALPVSKTTRAAENRLSATDCGLNRKLHALRQSLERTAADLAVEVTITELR
jgi:hypothetical protein